MATNNNAMTGSSKRLLTSAASLAASAMLIRTVINEVVPYEVRDYIFFGLGELRNRLSSQLTIVIQEKEGFTPNQIYEASKIYLATKISPSTKRLRVSKQDDEKTIAIFIEQGEEILDVFEGVQFKWKSIRRETQGSGINQPIRRGTRVLGYDIHNNATTSTEVNSFELSFDKKHKDMAFESYFPYVLERGKVIKQEDRALKLFMNERDAWIPITLQHPATFDTLAMESELKRAVMEDLSRFVKRKDYYKKIGKAWKRGYLLYGPPGTGKSSLVGAMANFLKFDIYNLELAEVTWNAALTCLLLGMANRSILVIEDIDCSIDLQNRNPNGASQGPRSSPTDKVTLSGLLNFVDGLWSSCAEERILVFTTNYKERLDPALLRPGRMDMHIHMSYCSPYGFRILASNYLAVDSHPLFGEIEGLIQEVEVTPAQVAEGMLKSGDAEVALQGLVKFLREKRRDGNEVKPHGEFTDNI